MPSNTLLARDLVNASSKSDDVSNNSFHPLHRNSTTLSIIDVCVAEGASNSNKE